MLAALHGWEAKPFSWKVWHRSVCEQFSSGDSCNKHQHSVTLFFDLYSGTVGAVVPLGDTGKAGTLFWATWCHRAWCGGGYALVLRFDVVSGPFYHREMVVPPTVFLKQVYWYGLGYQLCKLDGWHWPEGCCLAFQCSQAFPFLILPPASLLFVILLSLVTWEFLICLKLHPASLSYVSSLLKFSLATLKQS